MNVILILLFSFLIISNIVIFYKLLFPKKSKFNPNKKITSKLDGVYTGSKKIKIPFIDPIDINIVGTVTDNKFNVIVTGSFKFDCDDTFKTVGNAIILDRTNDCVDNALNKYDVKLKDIIINEDVDPIQIKMYFKKFINIDVTLTKQKETFALENVIDLTTIKPPNNTNDPELKVFADKKEFSPMFKTPLKAKSISPTNSVHLVVPGLLPASGKSWDKHPKDTIFYMPNDFTPHLHGEAQHHAMTGGFDIKKVFKVSSRSFVETKNKKLEEYRKKIQSFSNGGKHTAVETWIHWRIPYDNKEYPVLKVKKDSIIWWDFNNKHHNLNIVSEKSYNKNTINENDKDIGILVEPQHGNMQIIVTIMDKPGTYYFLCSVKGHAELGHKIIIVVE